MSLRFREMLYGPDDRLHYCLGGTHRQQSTDSVDKELKRTPTDDT